jgi:hypothetical protein
MQSAATAELCFALASTNAPQGDAAILKGIRPERIVIFSRRFGHRARA